MAGLAGTSTSTMTAAYSLFLLITSSSYLFITFSIAPVASQFATSSSPPPMSLPPLPNSPGPSPTCPPPPSRPGIKAAYWPSFTGFPISSINTSYFTHIFYAFLLPDPTSYQLVITSNDQQFLPQFSPTLKSQNPDVKTVLSIGGGGNNSTVFSIIVGCSSKRAAFIRSTIDVARQYGFDGLDLDWEFPGNQEDMNNLGILYEEWRTALDLEAEETGHARLRLSSAVYFASIFFLDPVVRAYPSSSMSKYLDWVSPMCFDYYGSWSNSTGEHAALYDPNSQISTSYGIWSWVNSGVPAGQLVMGLPLYGKSWTLMDPNVNGVGAPTMGTGPGDGTMIFADIVDFNKKNNAIVVYDQRLVSVYSYVRDAWIGYEDVSTIAKRIEFARSHGLGGYFFWALGQDKDWSISERASSSWDQ